ncbi:four helix bundle protein [Brumimicrobium aurantiacum]|uniref:Four helix bundle protein n=1 Tax=Brumimicrobium aurantiacum TaxID=1737063 RepID=A0A3E1EYY6_9FLAO|nr:four helix bundle protein [Brumimicrobium aurantiacum]RFC54779.1 four helix bundle protein [Brumimicrobium aurantiacum]
MPKISTFEDLNVWKLSRQLNIEMFRILARKDDKEYGFLINHLFKTSGSIMDNIAEGFERGGNKEFINFLSYSKGSAGELRSQFYRALDVEVLNKDEFNSLQSQTIEISKQLSLFIKYLKNSSYKGAKFKEPSITYGSQEID